ncbi:hypothetical protein [Streptomyces cupreus]|uniref:K1 capsule-specific polysaccharide lyase C-terminal domain-containing protein n=1 Tax=Streptomyces cupreus TaxID=2759956 RepID=A0A7X1M9D0_9ACTN|nr:hypothetical protein [Streptomyces cupreus]MBC2903144.1 hypothetical protein [Streptomyces cupreus]
MPLYSKAVALVGAASTTDVFTTKVAGDTDPQMVVNANGRLEWSGGVGAPDTALFRDGSARLHTINDFLSEGNLICDVAGKGLRIKEGSNARMGTATLVGGTVTVSNTSVTASTRIVLTRSTTGGTVGHLSYTVSAGTSFTINSSSGTDTSTVVWLLAEPA